jgi:Rrf2 family iron-sulfur cluster assembly transcriptional regulator
VRLETTRRSDLATRALITLAPCTEPLKSADLGERLSATTAFMSHVMAPLVTRGWVKSDPGRNGGYRLVVGLDEITVLQLIESVEGPTETGRCVVGDRPCEGEGTCALHDAWMGARQVLLDELAQTSVADVAHTFADCNELANQ